jgi:4-aminobutyrate aminotransferase
LNHLTEDVIVQGEGSWVTMNSGRRLLDFTCGIGVTNLGASRDLFFNHLRLIVRAKPGHCHPKVSKAAADQCLNLVHGQVSSFPRFITPRHPEQSLV